MPILNYIPYIMHICMCAIISTYILEVEEKTERKETPFLSNVCRSLVTEAN